MSIRAIVAGINDIDHGRDQPTAAEVVGVVARRFAERLGTPLPAATLRIFDAPPPEGPWPHQVREHVDELPLGPDVPFALGRLYELLLAPAARQRTGAHLTSAHIAQGLVGCVDLTAVTDDSPARVLDPAVGGAAFLLAAASRQVELGHDADEVFDRLWGIDIDPGAISVAEAALSLWLAMQARPPRPHSNLTVGDGLSVELPAVDLVVGNPPFLNQLARTSARSAERRQALQHRWGDLAGAYTDDAWLFVAAGLAALRRGSLAMIQPLSILSARHAEPVRQLVERSHRLTGLWAPFVKVFDASVDVCGVIIDVGDSPSDQAPISRWSGVDFVPRAAPAVAPQQGAAHAVTWGPLAAEMQGVPAVVLPQGDVEPLGSLATVTAGFRRQFYGFKPHVGEGTTASAPAPASAPASASVSEPAPAPVSESARLVTVGMIDPLLLLWGAKRFTFAGDRYRQPIVDLGSLAEDDPALMKWTSDRMRPKILVATQTRIVETWVDLDGTAVPTTPVISVEPNDPTTLWKLVAMLNAPVINARLAGASFGTALSVNAMKFSAAELGSLPQPPVGEAWDHAAALLEQAYANHADHAAGPFSSTAVREEFAALMTRAYDDETNASSWWLERLTALMQRHG